jgi:hypothetical protein
MFHLTQQCVTLCFVFMDLYGFHSKQRLLPKTALTSCFIIFSFVIVTYSVLFEVRTEFLNLI